SFAAARFNADGSPDGSFGTNGTIATSFAGDSAAYAVGLQEDGNIVVAGGRPNGGNAYSSPAGPFLLARYLSATGALDPGFGTGGKISTDVPGFGGANGLVQLGRDE